MFVKVIPGRSPSKVKESVKAAEEIGRVHRSNSGWESKRAVDGLLTHIYRTSSLSSVRRLRPRSRAGQSWGF